MDDLRTQEALDALADLFLTGTTPVRQAPVRRPPAAAPAGKGSSVPVPDHSRHTHSSLADELDGPRPIPMRGNLHATGASAAALADEEPPGFEEEPVALRLRSSTQGGTSADEEDSLMARDPLPAQVEAVFLGNLPGFGGPWLTQYAFLLAQQRGPVAVMHLTSTRIDVELVTAERQTFRQGIDDVSITGDEGDALVQRLDRLARDANYPVATWLLHLPASHEPNQILRAAAIAHWTVLCGADDAAIAGASRLAQQMLAAAGGGEAQPADAAGPATDVAGDPVISRANAQRRIGLVIMGADEAKANDAIERFNAAGSGFLRERAELIGSRKQMTPVHMRVVGNYEGNLWPALRAFLESLPSSSPLAASRQSTPPAAAAPAAPKPTQAPPYRDGAPAAPSPAAPRIATTEPSTSPRSPRQPAPPYRDGAPTSPPLAASQRTPEPSAPPAAPTPSPAPAFAPTASPAPSSEQPDLASFIAPSLGGGISLQARYPKQPDTQIVLDDAGRLHLLRRQTGSDLRSAIVDLMECRDWVREHLALLALTQRQCRFDDAAEPVLHLFTADARSAVAVAAKLGPAVKLHLLQEITVGQSRTWVCTDLN